MSADGDCEPRVASLASPVRRPLTSSASICAHLRKNLFLLAAVVGATCCLNTSPSSNAALTSLDDVQFWVGEGANRAGLAIDWDGQSTSDSSLVWGFRWDGVAHGETMLRAVLAADDRFYAKLGDPQDFPFGLAVFGLGYDANSDGMFGITDPDAEFDADGVAVASPVFPAPTATSPTDFYKEGWTAQRAWTYGAAIENPWQAGHWVWSGAGASTRELFDGAWDSWAFNLTATSQPNVFAANPTPALELAAADFDGDGDVDGADLLLWQRGQGLASGANRVNGNATADEQVDFADLAAWSNQFSGNPAASAAAAGIPEPTSFSICASAISLFLLRRLSSQRRSDS